MVDDEGGIGRILVRLGERRERRVLGVQRSGHDLGATTTTNAGVTGHRCRRLGRGNRRRRAATTRRRCGGRLLFDARAFLTLPPRAHASDLIVSEQTQMTAHRNVHLTK